MIFFRHADTWFYAKWCVCICAKRWVCTCVAVILVCTYACVFVCVYVRMYVCMHVCRHADTWWYAKQCVCIYVHVHECMYVFMHECLLACIMYVVMHVYVGMHVLCM